MGTLQSGNGQKGGGVALCIWHIWQGCSLAGLLGVGGCFKKPGDHLSLSVFWLVFDEPNNINKWTVFAKVVLLHF